MYQPKTRVKIAKLGEVRLTRGFVRKYQPASTIWKNVELRTPSMSTSRLLSKAMCSVCFSFRLGQGISLEVTLFDVTSRGMVAIILRKTILTGWALNPRKEHDRKITLILECISLICGTCWCLLHLVHHSTEKQMISPLIGEMGNSSHRCIDQTNQSTLFLFNQRHFLNIGRLYWSH